MSLMCVFSLVMEGYERVCDDGDINDDAMITIVNIAVVVALAGCPRWFV